MSSEAKGKRRQKGKVQIGRGRCGKRSKFLIYARRVENCQYVKSVSI